MIARGFHYEKVQNYKVSWCFSLSTFLFVKAGPYDGMGIVFEMFEMNGSDSTYGVDGVLMGFIRG
jgi:hypothetical protein